MNNGGIILQRTLDAFVARLEATEGFCLPKRRYIHFGEVVYDCEQLVVHGISQYQGITGSPNSAYAEVSMWSMEMGVTLVRRVPNMDGLGKPPTDKDLTCAAVTTAADAQALTDTFFAAFTNDNIVGPCDKVTLGTVTFNGPMGDFLGTVLDMHVQL